MNTLKKIWHDENSEPPKNYLWAKEGKLFKNINGQWKEISKKTDDGGSSEPTFDDVVKVLHNELGNESFPYTTWDEIPLLTADSHLTESGSYFKIDFTIYDPESNSDIRRSFPNFWVNNYAIAFVKLSDIT